CPAGFGKVKGDGAPDAAGGTGDQCCARRIGNWGHRSGLPELVRKTIAATTQVGSSCNIRGASRPLGEWIRARWPVLLAGGSIRHAYFQSKFRLNAPVIKP